MLLFCFVCSFTTPVRVIFLYHIWCINKPSYPILSYIYIYRFNYKIYNYIIFISVYKYKLTDSIIPGEYFVSIYIYIYIYIINVAYKFTEII